MGLQAVRRTVAFLPRGMKSWRIQSRGAKESIAISVVSPIRPGTPQHSPQVGLLSRGIGNAHSSLQTYPHVNIKEKKKSEQLLANLSNA